MNAALFVAQSAANMRLLPCYLAHRKAACYSGLHTHNGVPQEAFPDLIIIENCEMWKCAAQCLGFLDVLGNLLIHSQHQFSKVCGTRPGPRTRSTSDHFVDTCAHARRSKVAANEGLMGPGRGSMTRFFVTGVLRSRLVNVRYVPDTTT